MIQSYNPSVNITRCIAFLASLFIITACSTETKEQTLATTTGMAPSVKDSMSTTTQTPVESESPAPPCDCAPVADYGYYSEVSLAYYSDEGYQHEQDSILKYHLHNPQSLKSKTLSLRSNDAFHPEIKKFRHVEHIILSGHMSASVLQNLDLFPKLVSVIFDGANIELDTTQAWLGRVEQLRFIKCKMKGLRSFKQTPRLKSLIIGHSGFEYFPKDFNALSCLQELNIEEYKFGKDHPRLEEIDLRNFACLKRFRVWGGASGLPQGVDSTGKIELILRPWAMSDAELKTYKAWKKRIKNAG